MTDAYQLLTELAPSEYAGLKADIATHGVRVPVVVDAETGAIIDGHHRVRIVDELRAEGHKVPDYPRQVIRFADDDERAGFALAANLFRRHLSKRQRVELAVTLRGRGWSERRIAEALGIGAATVHRDLGTAPDGAVPDRITGKDGRSQPARRPPALFAANRRQAERAQAALVALPPGRASTSILRAETMAREATREAHGADVAEGASLLAGPCYELRMGDLREVWADLPDGAIDAIVTDPPYDEAGIPIFGDLAQLAARVLKPGRLAAIYCGHLQLDEEIRLLAEGGLTYVWHGVNVLPGRHTKIRTRKVNGRHRSVLLFSAGPYSRGGGSTTSSSPRGTAARRRDPSTSGSRRWSPCATGSRWSPNPARRSSTPSAGPGRPGSLPWRLGGGSSAATSTPPTSRPPGSASTFRKAALPT